MTSSSFILHEGYMIVVCQTPSTSLINGNRPSLIIYSLHSSGTDMAWCHASMSVSDRVTVLVFLYTSVSLLG